MFMYMYMYNMNQFEVNHSFIRSLLQFFLTPILFGYYVHKCMEYAMKKWTQLSMLLAKFQNTRWSSAEASAKEEWRVLAACSDTHINWPIPFQGARHDLVNNLT